MSLYFDNAEVLSLTYTPQYFGDLARFSVEKKVTVQGKVLDLTNSIGISDIWSGMALVVGNDDFQDINLNGVSFGNGKISNTSFSEGVDVRQKSYTTDITVYETGNLFNVQTGVYNGITYTSPEFIQDLAETISYSKGENGQSTYNHNIAITYREDFVGARIPAAQTFAENLFDANNFTNVLGSYGHNYNKIYTEVYDDILKTCNFSLTYNFFRESTDFSVDYNNSIQIDENGIITATEQGVIRKIDGAGITSVYTQLQTELANSLTRCNSLKTSYFNSSDSLKSTPLEQSTTINNFSYLIEYSVTYTNDSSINNGFSWQYTININKGQDGINVLSEQGTVNGYGRINDTKFDNALNKFNQTVKPSVLNRLQGYYNKYVSPNFSSIHGTNKLISFNRFNGVIEYSYTYSDDLTLQAGEITKIEINKSTSDPVHLSNNFNVLGFKEIRQPSNNSTIGTETTTVTLFGDRNRIPSLYSFALARIDGPGGQDPILTNITYSIDIFASSFSLSATYNYHGSTAPYSNGVYFRNKM